MVQKRPALDPKFKAQVALEALKERQTLNELASDFELKPQTISLCKQQLLEQALFAGNETRYHRLIEQAAKG